MDIRDESGATLEGHVLIRSWSDDGDVVVELDKRNAIHKENVAVAIARALAGQREGQIYSMHFGTGGATVNALDQIVYATPNTSGAADLNVPAYSEVVDQSRGAPSGNGISISHVAGTTYADVEIRCILDKTEPTGQATVDNITTNLAGSFVFDEIGLKTSGGVLLTHITFNPIQKTSNRILEVRYTIRVRVF
jgi:hypothetical protein